MARTLSTDNATLADAGIVFYKLSNGIRYRVTVHSTDRTFHVDHDEDLTDALAAMVTAGTITNTQRTAFVNVARALRERARTATNLDE